MISPTTTGKLDLERVIQGAVKSRLAEIIEEEAEKTAERIAERMRGEADRLALQVFSLYELSQNRENLVITVKKA